MSEAVLLCLVGNALTIGFAIAVLGSGCRGGISLLNLVKCSREEGSLKLRTGFGDEVYVFNLKAWLWSLSMFTDAASQAWWPGVRNSF